MTDVTPRDIVDAVRASDHPVTIGDISIILGCSTTTIENLIDDMSTEFITRTDDGRWRLTDDCAKGQTDVTDVEPFDGPETNAVDLIEANRNDD